MSEKEKKILETIVTAVPKMSEFDKGYLLGMGEAMVNQKKQKNKNEEECEKDEREKDERDGDSGNSDTD